MKSKLESLESQLTQDEQLSGQLVPSGGCPRLTYIIDDHSEDPVSITLCDT